MRIACTRTSRARSGRSTGIGHMTSNPGAPPPLEHGAACDLVLYTDAEAFCTCGRGNPYAPDGGRTTPAPDRYPDGE